MTYQQSLTIAVSICGKEGKAGIGGSKKDFLLKVAIYLKRQVKGDII